jgi:phospholipase C
VRNLHKGRLIGTASALAVAAALSSGVAVEAQAQPTTTTPIKHIVIIFGENISFDHYFGTYPNALNLPTDINPLTNRVSHFTAKAGTPTVNGLTGALLTDNPNTNAAGTAQANPIRFTPQQAFTCSQNHNYQPEEEAVDGGLMDKFPLRTGRTTSVGCAPDGTTVMSYFDGNTVTALWNYAQNFSMNDNHFGSNFGPSTPGAINLISGQTFGATVFKFSANINAGGTPVAQGPSPFPGNVPGASVFDLASNSNGGTDFGDVDPFLDDCGADAGGTVLTDTMQMSSLNIGDLLNKAGVTWGWFQGGFAPTSPASGAGGNPGNFVPATCNSSHTGHTFGSASVPDPVSPLIAGEIHTPTTDYVPHHQPFQYYVSTRNPHHLRPSSTAMIGQTDQANHQYDTIDFFAALSNGNLPAVSYVKAPAYQDAHPGNSDPLLEQTFVVQVVNALMQSKDWESTAIIIDWDDSDGWYDHVTGPVISQSNTINDAFHALSNGLCGTAVPNGTENRCGYGPRIPFLIISPWAKTNYVDHTLLDQTSSLAFIEENWGLGFLDGPSGQTPLINSSFDRFAGSIMGMFDFSVPHHPQPLILVPTSGEPQFPFGL